MEKHAIVPDIIDKLPTNELEIVYAGNLKVQLGNELTPQNVKDAPSVTWPSEDQAYYTLIMTDPDAPSRTNPKQREWHHWIVGNIPGCQIEKGETLSQYIGAGPPKATGLHRYVLLVYKQPSILKFLEDKLPNTSGVKRGKFSTRKFAKKYNLGNPIAGNLFRAQWDTYVPTLYKKLGG